MEWRKRRFSSESHPQALQKPETLSGPELQGQEEKQMWTHAP